MKERISIRLCSSFIYVYFARYIFAWELQNSSSLVPILFYFVTALCITLFLEAFHYLIIDLIKYSKLIIGVILLLSGLILYCNFSYYYLVVLLYIDIIMIKELIQAYQMYKSLIVFQTKNREI